MVLLIAAAPAQEGGPAAPAAGPDLNSTLTELQSEVRDLKTMVQQLKQETSASRAEIVRLRQELEKDNISAMGGAAGSGLAAQTGDTAQTPVDLRVGQLEDEQELLTGKVNEQYQTKVESASKYRIRLTGIALFNLFSNQGAVDNMDVPSLANRDSYLSPSGSFGGTLRQSIFGFEIFGPELMGARTSGAINFGIGGGFPYVYNGVNSGLVSLRTATMRLDWKDTSLVAGQDQLFFQPNMPTSFASVLVPPLSYSGNLWAWTPEIHAEHRFVLSENSSFTLQGGILDALTGEPPYYYTWYRTPQAGERSRQPGYAGRVAYSHTFFGRPLTVGAAGYYSRENWGYGRNVNGYSAMADWSVPLTAKLLLSGSFYRGQAIGGLGAAEGRSVLYSGALADPTSLVIPLNTVGGWAQLKYKATSKIEFNAAYGQDNPFASDLQYFREPQSYGDPSISRNQSVFGNVIYRPRSDILFSLEYRRIRTSSIYGFDSSAGQINLGMGILF
jgi:hypothetical protein